MKPLFFGPDDEQAFFARRDELVADFTGWVAELPVRVDPQDLGLLLDWKWGYGGGRLDLWRRADLSEFLLSWCPRKLSAPAESVHALPSAVCLAMSFLATRDLLAAGSDPVERLTAHAMSLQAEFMEEMSNPANFGMAKTLFGQLGIDDPSALDADSLQRAIEEFNALPEAVRREATASAPGGQADDLPTVGPVLTPDEAAVRAAAEEAPLLAGFTVLSDYFAAPGKPLTATGNLKIADARALVDLLGTDDLYEQSYGDHVYRKRSSSQFIELDHWQWWAREAGVLRKQGSKLVAVKAWRQRRRQDPVGEIRKAFGVVMATGLLSSYWPHMRFGTHELLDASIGPLFGSLLQSPMPLEFDALAQQWTEMSSTLGYQEYFPGEIASSLDQMLTLLERAGLVTQQGAVLTATTSGGQNRSAGTVQLTPVGVVLGVEVLSDQGIEVELVPSVADMDADELAALTDVLEPQEWWATAGTWLSRQPDASQAVAGLIDQLADRSLTMLILALGEAPESSNELLTPILRDLAFVSRPPPADLGSVALNWLLQKDRVRPEEVTDDLRLDATLGVFGILAESDPALVSELLEADRDPADDLELVATVGRRMPPRAVDLLEAIGGRHPVKAVAKAARKEAFRVRSRLLTRQR